MTLKRYEHKLDEFEREVEIYPYAEPDEKQICLTSYHKKLKATSQQKFTFVKEKKKIWFFSDGKKCKGWAI